MKCQRILPLLVALAAAVAPGATTLAQVRESADTAAAERFTRAAETVLKPVYGFLAEDIVSSYGLGDAEGIGIDAGGGPGHLVVELARRSPRMYWIDADINPAFFPFAAELAGKAGVGDRIGLIEADVHELPFRDGYADIVVSRGSFPFWRDLPVALAEIYRVLKPGGAAWIGRGFPENLPVETARGIREKQGGGGGPAYEVEETAALFGDIMRSLGVADFTVHTPHSGGDVNYGVWLEFRKPGSGAVVSDRMRRSVSRPVPEETADTDDRGRVYILEPLEVRGTAGRNVVEEPLAESAALDIATSVVDRREIEKQGASTVIEALQFVPGARIETRGRKVKQFFSVRGQTYPYPNYAVDGALFREFHEVPYFFSAGDIERIEILRSSAAMLSGVSGLAGVVNIVPRRYDEPETRYELEYGSFDTYRARLSHGGKVNDVSYAISLDAPHTDGPKDRHAAEAMTFFQGTVDWRAGGRLSVRSSLFHIYGKRELARAEPPAAARFRETMEAFDPFGTTFASLRAHYRPKDTMSTELVAYYADRNHTFVNLADDGHVSTSEWDYEWGLNLVQAVALSGNNTLRGGVYYNRWVAPGGKRFFAGRRCDLETFSTVVVDEHRFGRLVLDGGLRLEKTYIHDYGAFNIDGSGKKFRNVEPVTDEWEPVLLNGSLGAVYHLSEPVSLSMNLAAGIVRPREGTLDTEGAEPENERRIKLDAGVRLSRADIGEATVTGFLTLQRDAIVLSGRTEERDGRVMELYLNRDQRQTGIELDARSATIRRTARLFFNAVLMTTEADMDGGMKRVGEYPDAILGGGVYSVFSAFDLNLFWKYVSSYENSRFTAAPGGRSAQPQPLGDYHTVNCTVGRSFGSSRAYFEITNLFDKRFSTVVGYPDYGRRYTVGIRQVF